MTGHVRTEGLPAVGVPSAGPVVGGRTGGGRTAAKEIAAGGMSPEVRPAGRRPRSLRGSLTLANVALLALALLLAMAASLVGVWTLLIGQLDDALRADAVNSARLQAGRAAVADGCSGGSAFGTAFRHRSPFAVLDSRGRVPAGCAPGADARALAAVVADPVALVASGDGASVRLDDKVLRVAALRLDDGRIMLVSTPMAGMMSTVKELFVLELMASTGLLTMLALVSQRAARRRLRPLEDMVQTASAIAAGHLGRRIDGVDGSAEVAELRHALNTMLEQVETAFRCREETSEQLKQFAADASHELRTPLATIRGYTQLYGKGMLDAEERDRAMSRIASEADRMSGLVEKLLALARLEQQPEPRRRPVDLAQLSRDAAADLRAVQHERPVTLGGVLKDGAEAAHVLGDEAQLRQLVSNLMSNVSVHTPAHAPVTVEVSTDGDGVLLRVADSGPGMWPQDAARIFDRFFRADPDRARQTGGSGLGMSIVRAVVQAHGGTLRVDTALGEGMTVEVSLPRAAPVPE